MASEQALAFCDSVQGPPLAENVVDMNDLGSHPMSILPDVFLFDSYCHLRHDILRPGGPIDRPEPRRDEARLRPAIEWMLAGMPWMCPGLAAVVDRPLVLELTGVGGGTFTVYPAGGHPRVSATEERTPTAAACVISDAHEFVAWGTRRCPWRDSAKIEGDDGYAAEVLDAINIF